MDAPDKTMTTEEPNTATTVRNPYSKTSPNLVLAPDLTSPLAQPPMLDTTNAYSGHSLQLNSSVKTDHESSIEFIPTSNNLPIVDRLLSRNLSFTSAEIVTVRELNTALTCSFPSVVTGKSVRFVGSIAFVDTVNMWVLLSDPSPSQPTSATTNPYQKARVSDGIRFSLDNKSDLNSDRLSIEGLPRKRKLVSTKTPRNSSILNKRFSIDPQDSHLQIIEENQRRNIAMIVVDIALVPSLFNCAVGDQLMVIGEIREISNSSNSSNLSDTLKVLYRIRSCKQHDNSLNVDEHDQQQTMVESNEYQYSIIKARIIRNYSGVDMNLFEEALKLRRKYLKDQGAQYGTGLLSE